MRFSRLRLRLAAGFSLALAVGLGLFAVGALGYLWRESNRRLDARLVEVTEAVARGMTREVLETPDSALAYAAGEVVLEWPASAGAFAIVDSLGRSAAALDRDSVLTRILASWPRTGFASRFDIPVNGANYRAVARLSSTRLATGGERRFTVIAFGSTEGIETDTELLGGTVLVAAPLIVLLSLVGGYLLARRALLPVDALGRSLASMAPEDLSRRLPVGPHGDEVDTLAERFNALLERLDAAQSRNRKFVRETAHQIRTPLTLVLGEAEHALAGCEGAFSQHAIALRRVKLAAEQMQRRVDELFLLAEAEAGVAIALNDDVELDGLALECADLMRARASSLGRTLSLGDISPAVVRGNAPLLREALLEMLENGCRHGAVGVSVTTDVKEADDEVQVLVSSGRPNGSGPAPDGRGLGQAIVSWIAVGHGGRFESAREGNLFVSKLILPSVRR